MGFGNDQRPYTRPLMTPTGLAIDKALALGRLAVLKERVGDAGAALNYWQRASSEAATAGWRDTSPAGVRAVIERLDPCRERLRAK